MNEQQYLPQLKVIFKYPRDSLSWSTVFWNQRNEDLERILEMNLSFYPNFSRRPLSVVNGSPPPGETTLFLKENCVLERMCLSISGWAKMNWIFRFSPRWARSSPMPAKVLQDTPKHSALFVRLANRPFSFLRKSVKEGSLQLSFPANMPSIDHLQLSTPKKQLPTSTQILHINLYLMVLVQSTDYLWFWV